MNNRPQMIKKPRASVQALGCRLNQYEGLTMEGNYETQVMKLCLLGNLLI